MQFGTAALVLLWCLWKKQRTGSSGYLLTLVLSIRACWQLLFGPGTEQVTYGIIAPSMAWSVAATFGSKQRGHVLALTACAIESCSAWAMSKRKFCLSSRLQRRYYRQGLSCLLYGSCAMVVSWFLVEREILTATLWEPDHTTAARSGQIHTF